MSSYQPKTPPEQKKAYFRTDSDYHNKPSATKLKEVKVEESDLKENEPELKEWNDSDHHPVEHIDMEKDGGSWTPNDMFRANEELGVKTTYESIEVYSNAQPVGGEKERKKADKIAKQIEENSESQFNAKLEDLDEERDIGPEERPPQRHDEGHRRQNNKKQHDRGKNRPLDHSTASKRQSHRQGDSKDFNQSRGRQSHKKWQHEPKSGIQSGDWRQGDSSSSGKKTNESKRVTPPKVEPLEVQNQEANEQKGHKFNLEAREFVPKHSDSQSPVPPSTVPSFGQPTSNVVHPPPVYPTPMIAAPYGYNQYYFVPFQVPMYQQMAAYQQQMVPGYNQQTTMQFAAPPPSSFITQYPMVNSQVPQNPIQMAAQAPIYPQMAPQVPQVDFLSPPPIVPSNPIEQQEFAMLNGYTLQPPSSFPPSSS